VSAVRRLVAVGLALLAVGCATPVGVTPVDVEVAYRLQYQNVLSAHRPSEPSKSVLRRLGILERFEDEPAAVIAELHQGLLPTGDEDRLFALAELSFLQAEQTGDRGYFLASAVYAYALLFPGRGAGVRLPSSDPRVRLAYDLYNQGLARGLSGVAPVKTAQFSDEETLAEVHLEPGTHALPFGQLVVDLDPAALSWAGYRLDRFVSTTDLRVRGLRNRYWHPGLGASLAASLAPGEASGKGVGAERIAPRTKVPVTALLRLENARENLVTGVVRGRLEINPVDLTSIVTVDGRPQQLEFDTTAALAYQLEGSPLYGLEIVGFLRGGMLGRVFPHDRAQDGLGLLWPYRPGKIPVVLVHGTASSAARWAELVNELLGDPRIRERFQLWLFLYDTGNPIGYSAGRLRAALTATVKELDPEGKDPALRRMVVIGHSQGGLLAKLTAVDSGNRFWNNVTSKPFDSLKLDAETRELLQQSLFFTPLPFVETVIFISTPHRGALMAGNRLGAIAGWLVTLPGALVSHLAEVATASGDEGLILALQKPPTAIDNMSPRNRFVQTLVTIPVAPGVDAHSIIAVKGRGPVGTGDDGVVSYESAHIDGAKSELVVRSGHSAQGTPQAIEEVRRILLEHAAATPED
jgi:pimeloyl-ACP methyl ester carboxylesterase